MAVDKDNLEIWIICTLKANELNGISVREIIKDGPQSLIEGIQSSLELENFLYTLEEREFPLIRHMGDRCYLTDDGHLRFRNIVGPMFQALQNRNRYEKIIDSGDASDKIKKELKKFLKDLSGQVKDDVIAEIIRYMTIRGKEELWEIVRILIDFSNSGGNINP